MKKTLKFIVISVIAIVLMTLVVPSLCEVLSKWRWKIASKAIADDDIITIDSEPSYAVSDGNDIPILQIDKAVCIAFTFPDANSVDEAAAALREMDTRNAKEFIDIEVTIGDETHTASFEEFFEWMGFRDKSEFCITKFGDGIIEEINFISPDDPNALMTVREFIFRVITYEPDDANEVI